jgi:hypothetical protein
VSEEMSQTLLTKKKLGKINKYKPQTLSSHPSFALNRRNMFILLENKRSPKLFENHLNPCMCPGSNHTCQQKPNPSGDPVSLKHYNLSSTL